MGIRVGSFDFDIDIDMSFKELPRYAICSAIIFGSVAAIVVGVLGLLGIFSAVLALAGVLGAYFAVQKYFEYPDRNPSAFYSEARNSVVRRFYGRSKIGASEFAAEAGISGVNAAKASLVLSGAGVVIGVNPGHFRASDKMSELFIFSPETLPSADKDLIKHSEPFTKVEVYLNDLSLEFKKIVEYSGGRAVALDLKGLTFGAAVKAVAEAMGDNLSAVEAHIEEARKYVPLV